MKIGKMTKRTRTILFLCTVFLFLITAPATIFYTQGYRIDFQRKEIIQTGALALKAWPKVVKVYIDGKQKKETDFLFGQTTINNLIPKTYSVRLSKEGYFDWQKELEIKERQVTVAQNIILIPKSPEFTETQKGVESAWLSRDGKKIAIEKKNRKERTLEIINLKNGETIKTLDLSRISLKAEDELAILDWSANKILLKIRNTYAIAEEQGTTEPIPLNFIKDKILHFAFHPVAEEKVLILLPGQAEYNLFEANWKEETINPVPLLHNVLAFTVLPQGILWLGQNGSLSLSDFSGGITNILSAESIQINPEAGYQIFAKDAQKIILKEGNSLLFFNPAKRNFERITDSIKDFIFSPDGQKAVFFNNYEIYTLYLEEQKTQPQKQIGEHTFLTRLSEEIQQVIWINSHYLAFIAGSKIKIAEIDDRDGVNITDITLPQSKDSLRKMYFSEVAKKLYILLGTELLESKKLMP